jgi:cytochrome d ubiquinol oxidase subunit I
VVRDRIEEQRWLLWLVFISFPLPFIAILTGWFTAEVGRQPWVVYGLLRTADAVTPFLTARQATISLATFCVIYTLIFAFGIIYINRLLHAGPVGHLVEPPITAVPNRPMSLAGRGLISDAGLVGGGERP